MGGEFTYQPKWDPIGFDPQPNKCGQRVLHSSVVFRGTLFWLAFKGSQKENRHFEGPIKKRATHTVEGFLQVHQLVAGGSSKCQC